MDGSVRTQLSTRQAARCSSSRNLLIFIQFDLVPALHTSRHVLAEKSREPSFQQSSAAVRPGPPREIALPIERELRYKIVNDSAILEAGAGHTTNIGSGGVLFSLDRELAPGTFVQLSISWPVLLEGECLVRLVSFGRVLRCAGGHCACTIDKYEFRTQARRLDASGARRDAKLERWADTIRREELKARFAVV